MNDLPVIRELRAVRQRLAEEQAFDVDRYAAMLREVARTLPGEYVTQPFLPPVEPSLDTRDAG
jgi:hypothetical protein